MNLDRIDKILTFDTLTSTFEFKDIEYASSLVQYEDLK